MPSDTPPSCADDFIMLEAHQTHDLPLRQRCPNNEAEQYLNGPSSDDDLEYISRPGSVRSLNTLSPLPSPSLLPAVKENSTAVSLLVLQSSNAISQRPQTFQERRLSEAHSRQKTTSESPIDTVRTAKPPIELPPTPTCHDHATIDQQIMDLLIEHALTTRIEQEYGHGCSQNKKLRQQMMTRFRGLPADHALVKESMTHVDGSKTLFQGQPRSMGEVEHIYLAVFTDLERMALKFLVECHIRHFERACSFHGSFMPAGRDLLQRTLLQQGSEQGKSLALDIQTKVLEHLDMNAFKAPFDDLRQHTRTRIDYFCSTVSRPSKDNDAAVDVVSNSQAAYHAKRPPILRITMIRCIFQTTVANLPNDRYSFDDPINFRLVATPPALKRQSPDDGEQEEEDVSPRSKRLQADLHTSRMEGNDPCQQLDIACLHYHPVLCASDDEQDKFLFVWNGADHKWTSAFYPQDLGRRNALRDISTKIERLYYREHKSQTKLSSQHRQHGEALLFLQLFMLEQQCKTRYAQARGRSHHQSHEYKVQPEQLSPPSLLLQPVGRLFRDIQSLGPLETLSDIEYIWIVVHAKRCAVLCSEELKQEFVDRILQDPEVKRHTSEHHLSPTDYAFHIDALLLLRSMQFACRHGFLEEEIPATAEQSTASNCTRAEDRASSQTLESLHQLPLEQSNRSKHPQPTAQEQSPVPVFPARSQDRSAMQDFQMQLMLLEQQNRRRALLRQQATGKQHPAQLAIEKCQKYTLKSIEKPQTTERHVPFKDDDESCSRLGQFPDAPRLNINRDSQLNQYALDDHSRALSRNLPAGTKPPAREYRQNTLLARSTQLPIPSAANVDKKPNLMRTVLCLDDDEYEPEEGTSASKTAKWEYSFAPAVQAHGTYKTMNLRKEQIALLEGTRAKEKSETKADNADPSVSNLGAPRFSPDFHRRDSLSTHIARDYQQQLMLLEQANRRRLLQRGSVGSNVATSDDRHPEPASIVRADNNGVIWMAFEHTRLGVKMEYTIRTDVESIDTDALSQSFKEVNCVQASWRGWRLTPELTRETSNEKSTRASRTNAATSACGPKQEEEPARILQQKLKENKIAWGLAKLNPCLQEKQDLLQAAVQNFMNLPSTSNVENPHGPAQNDITNFEMSKPLSNRFILQCPEEIMNDPHIEEEDSSSEDNDEDCYDDEETDPDFPRALVDTDGVGYMTFEHGSVSTSNFYTIRIDLNAAPFSSTQLLSSHGICICHKFGNDHSNQTAGHYHECETAMALASLNSWLLGKENGSIRLAAALNYAMLTQVVKWQSSRSSELKTQGYGKVVNEVIPERDVDSAFVLFRHNPIPSPLSAQCSYCNMILDGSRHVDRIVHMILVYLTLQNEDLME